MCLRFDLHDLNSFRKNELTIRALFAHESHHPVSGVQLLQFCKRTDATVSDVVVAEITECHYRLSGFCYRTVCGSVYRITEDAVRFTCLEPRLPQILTSRVLELTDRCEGLVIHDKRSTLAVRSLQGIDQIDHFIRFDGSRSGSHTDLAAFFGIKDTGRLILSIAIEKCILLSIPESLCKGVKDEVLKSKCIVGEKFLWVWFAVSG